MDDDPKAYEGLMREYFEKHYERHLREVNRRETPQGRMEEAFEESDWTIAHGFYRFFESEINMKLAWEDAMPLAQRVLFSQLFRQRFLMTTTPAALGGVTAKRFLPHTGQVYAFRSCALTP